ncbi:HD domain-containing protein [Candidatus Parcubacteria bacterium]|nr:HD domain-containing protein [Candidatus Parcubacteria bacterium]
MSLTPKVKRAIDLAAVLHARQKRKNSGLPYVTHVYGVAMILAGYTADEDVVAAGLLHDVLEDVAATRYGAAELKRQFGNRVYDMVEGVSDDKTIRAWRERKQAYLDHLAEGSGEVLMISAADLIHNLTSLAEDYVVQGPKVWRRFHVVPSQLHWFWAARIKLIKSRLDSPIVAELEAAYRAVEQRAF